MNSRAKIDFERLLGFDSVGDRISGSVDFQDETLGAKLGAKVGIEVTDTPSNETLVK